MGRPAVDITGQRFGMLTAERKEGQDTYGRPLWRCQCDCGGVHHVTSTRLRSGNTQSCGCILRTHKVDHTGQRFGMLTAIRPVFTESGSAPRWHCICDCGGTKEVLTGRLVSGNTQSCGCRWRAIKDEIGNVYGRLTVVHLSHQDADGEAHWHCDCTCGNKATVAGSRLRNGKTRSCGCYGTERRIIANSKHNQSNTPLYKVWSAMKQRCTNPNASGYKDYGERGIRYHPDFETFEGFHAYVKDLYVNGLEMDRIDNDGDYTYGNLRWVEHRTQMENTRRTAIYTRAADATKVTLRRMAEEHELTPKALAGRLARGATLEDALSRKQHERPKRARNDIGLIGQRFSHLTISGFSHSDANYQKYYHCDCDCGKRFVARLSSIKYGSTQSCGCLQAKVAATKNTGKSWRLNNHTIEEIKEIKRALWSMDSKDVAVYYNIPLHTVRKLQSQDIYADVDEMV